MSLVPLRDATECRYDIVSLGEVMLRLDPGEGRIRTARSFRAWEGGGEYNVARGLSKCFGQRAAIVTALADNEIGHLVEDCIMQGGVDTSYIQWSAYDGLGIAVRNGLNFTERGFGVRGAVGVSDRGHTAISQLQPGTIDWDHLFGQQGVRWFHTGGIFAALSDSTAAVAKEAMQAARRYGTVISYDLNYRPSLWTSRGGVQAAQTVNKELAQYVDVMIGNEEDFTACLGFEVAGIDSNLQHIEVATFQSMIEQVRAAYDNFKVIATTLRAVHTASCNDWGAISWADGAFYQAVHRPHLDIMDRVGGGDSFASGLIYGYLKDLGPEAAVNYGAAHGALAMTTPGDTTMATLKEVEHLVAGAGARVQR